MKTMNEFNDMSLDDLRNKKVSLVHSIKVLTRIKNLRSSRLQEAKRELDESTALRNLCCVAIHNKLWSIEDKRDRELERDMFDMEAPS